MTSRAGTRPATATPAVTAGLKWPPERWPNAVIASATPKPKPAVFLDRPVDALDDLSGMHRDPACPVRQLVPTLLLTVLGVNVDERLAEAGARQIDDVQPVLLDRELSLDVVREQMTCDSKLLIADIEVRPNETDEEP